jgi:hypothetical protein
VEIAVTGEFSLCAAFDVRIVPRFEFPAISVRKFDSNGRIREDGPRPRSLST